MSGPGLVLLLLAARAGDGGPVALLLPCRAVAGSAGLGFSVAVVRDCPKRGRYMPDELNAIFRWEDGRKVFVR